MNSCISIPAVGQICRDDLTLRIGDSYLDLTHPSFSAVVILALAVGVFVFRNPA